MSKHYIFRIGDGKNFNASSKKSIWGIKSQNSFGKYFIKNVKNGDLLWFVTSNSKGHIVAVSTFTSIEERIRGPLIEPTYTNDELGWTGDDDWDMFIYYKDLYNISDCKLFSEIKCPSSIRLYNSDKCKVDLPTEYLNIIRYSKITNNM